MKKIILTVILAVLILPTYVFATSAKFYEGEYLPDAYIKKFKAGSTTGKYEQMRLFRRKSDNIPAYCIELWENLDTNIDIEEYTASSSLRYSTHSNMSEEKWKQVEAIAYYGYGYQNHTDINWYTATQFLIWKTISTDSTIYFTDTLNGNKKDKFTSEMTEIMNLVNEHYKIPSFSGQNYTVEVGKELNITDTNNVLENFKPTDTKPIYDINKSKNNITMKFNKAGSYSIEFLKGTYGNTMKLYVSPTSQDLLVRGNYSPLRSSIFVNVIGGGIVITKLDNDTNTTTPQGEAKLEGAIYELYNENMELVTEVSISSINKAVITSLPFGKYYLKEKKSGIGYKLDNNTYTINLTSQNPNTYLNLTNQVIKSKLKINKSYQQVNDNKTYKEENAIFSIYDKNNTKIGEIKTDINGTGEIILPYGTYTVIQESGKENYHKVESFQVTIDEEKEELIEYNLINKEESRSLKVIKIDKDSKLPIRFSNIKFKIKEISTNTYLKYQNKDIFETDNTGKILLPIKLSYGKYLLEEVKPPVGYKKITEPISFEITKNSEEIVELYIENEKEYGELEIIKYGEEPLIENNQLTYNKKPLSNTEFSLYAKEDIISADGTVKYYKGTLISTRKTNKLGIINFNNLQYGEYYLIETKTNSSYQLDTNKYFIKIDKEHLKHTLEKINYLKNGTINILKLDNVTSLPIPNTEFDIYNSNKQKIGYVKTNSEGKTSIFNLPLGKYYVKEVNVPFPYILSDDFKEITISSDQETINLTFKNNKQLLEEEVPHTSVSIKSNDISYFCLYSLAVIILIKLKKLI